MDVSDMIVSMLHIKKYVLALIAYYFITRKSVSKEIEHNKERKYDFRVFKEEVERN